MAGETKGCDYAMSPADADNLRGIVLLPHDLRIMALRRVALKGKTRAQIVDLFAAFIGMANSVVENNREMIEMELVTAGGFHPNTAEKINLPTIFGALGGVAVAAGCQSPKRCGGCAYRLGTPANQSPCTTLDAEQCADERELFHCHEEFDDAGNPVRVCAGWAEATRARRGTPAPDA